MKQKTIRPRAILLEYQIDIFEVICSLSKNM